MVLLAQAHKTAHGYGHESDVPLVVCVDVRHVADDASLGVEDTPLAEVRVAGDEGAGGAPAG